MMIAMQAETLAGLIGFGGAVVGAGGALLGGWLQQRYQADIVVRERQNARGYAAGEKALLELAQLRQHLIACTVMGDVSAEHQPWRLIAIRHLDNAEVAILLIPNASVIRERLIKALYCARRFELAGQHRPEQVAWIKACSSNAIDMLASRLRGDAIPALGLEAIREKVRRNDAAYARRDRRRRR
ncbi:hypothetical protein ACFYXF_33090 [Streptomyces sp. NPDC002680]|uniref:hypothetical protein n=1 Tax=Streptomyces sp. NPDC002680 TaxID=3364659 RepID=UPI003679457F